MRILIQTASQLKFKEELLWLGTTTLATVIIWIIYAVYVAYNTPMVDPDVQSLLRPLNPTLNDEILKTLPGRYVPQEPYTILVYPEGAAEARPAPMGIRGEGTTETPVETVPATSSAILEIPE